VTGLSVEAELTVEVATRPSNQAKIFVSGRDSEVRSNV
jgi:hypothetical protein